MDRIGANAFIVISGPPQKGKRERISKVRSHITKGYFRRQNEKSRIESRIRHAQVPAAGEEALVKALDRTLPPEIQDTVLAAAAGSSLSDSTSLASETTRRMQKCRCSFLADLSIPVLPNWQLPNSLNPPFYVLTPLTPAVFDLHMRSNIHSSPFCLNVIVWCTLHPHFTSTKILNASAWDDVQDSGTISPWTMRQRSIALRLVDDAMKNDDGKSTDSNIAAIQSLLGFEVINGAGDNYLRLRKFSRAVLAQGVRCSPETWIFLQHCFFLLDQANRLSIASDPAHEPTVLDLPHDFPFRFPLNLDLFTFGERRVAAQQDPIYGLLADLYYALSIAERAGKEEVTSEMCESLASRCSHLQEEIARQDGGTQSINEKIRDTPIRLCIILILSRLCPSSTLSHLSSSEIINQIRTHLSTVVTETEHQTAWQSFPGALVWCHAIGIRFANPTDKTWFIMQFLRMSHSWCLERWDISCWNVCSVCNALDNIRPLAI